MINALPAWKRPRTFARHRGSRHPSRETQKRRPPRGAFRLTKTNGYVCQHFANRPATFLAVTLIKNSLYPVSVSVGNSRYISCGHRVAPFCSKRQLKPNKRGEVICLGEMRSISCCRDSNGLTFHPLPLRRWCPGTRGNEHGVRNTITGRKESEGAERSGDSRNNK